MAKYIDTTFINTRYRMTSVSGGTNQLRLNVYNLDNNLPWPPGTWFEIHNADDADDIQIVPWSGTTINQIHGTDIIAPGQVGTLYLTDIEAPLGTFATFDLFISDAPGGGGGAVVEPNTQVVYGTGAAVDSNSYLIWDVATGGFNVNYDSGDLNVAAPSDITIQGAKATGVGNNGGSIYIYSGEGQLATPADSGRLYLGVNSVQSALGFDGDGTWLVGNAEDAGLAGQFLQTSGPAAEPAWEYPQVKPIPLTQVNDPSTAYDMGSALHHNVHFRFTAASAVTVTVRPDAFWAGSDQWFENDYTPASPGPMPIGGTIVIGQIGAGTVSFVAGGGVTINSPGGALGIAAQYGKVTLIKVGADEWDLEGNL